MSNRGRRFRYTRYGQTRNGISMVGGLTYGDLSSRSIGISNSRTAAASPTLAGGGWLEDARIFLWSLRVDPPPGRRYARSRSLVATAGRLRVLIQWMVGEARRGFDELARDAAQRFMHYIAERRRHAGSPIRPATPHTSAHI